MKEAFLFEQLKEYLTKDYMRMSDEKDQILQEKVHLEVEREKEENPLFDKKDTEKIKRMFSPFEDSFFDSVNVESEKVAELNRKIDELENNVNNFDLSMDEVKKFISFVQFLEKKWTEDDVPKEIVEKKDEEFKEYQGNTVNEDAKAMISAAVGFLENEYPHIDFFMDTDENDYIISSEANSNLIRILTYTISSTIESFAVNSVWIEIKRTGNDMLISLQLVNDEGLVGHYAYKSALTII